MAVVAYPAATHEKALELAELLAEAPAHMVDYWETLIAGFWDGLRTCLPSEAVGLLIVAHEEAVESIRRKADAEVD